MNGYDFSCATVTLLEALPGVAEVVLAQTGKANRMGLDYWSQMPLLFERLGADDAVRAVVIRGEEHFSFGLDLTGMGDLAELFDPNGGAKSRTKLMNQIGALQKANTAVAQCPKPVIAAISGWCIGGGVDLITACDVRLASADAKLSVREVRMGMVADVGTLARLPPIVGQGVARELALTGDDVDAARAQRIGLVNEVFPTRDALFEAARKMAARIAQNPPLVVQGVKRVLNAQSERLAAESLATVAVWNAAFLPSKDLGEAIGAFVEKRSPTFTGE